MILRVGYSYAVDCAKLLMAVSYSLCVNSNVWVKCVPSVWCPSAGALPTNYPDPVGVHLLCGKKLRLSLHEYKAKLFGALNSILYRVKEFSNDIVIMHLIQSYCKPLLLYACECFNMTRSEISQLCKAWRCVYWKVFKVSTDEAIEHNFI